MRPEHYQKLKQLFMAAFRMEPAERSAFLDKACGDDKDLRDQIESIFRHHDPATVIEAGPVRLQPEEATPNRQGAEVLVRQIGDASLPGPIAALPLPAGTMVTRRYRIVGLLGRGGMGQVYRADDLELGQPVALKFLATGLESNPLWLARLREEVRLARQVTHPNVCRVHDICEADGNAFLSMEYIDGEDLRSLLRRIGRLPQDKAIEVARQLCAGLAAAHEQGVLHRDLKPANIMLDGTGQVKITDFGIASAAPQPNQRLPIAGTPAYIAPEILAARPPSPQSDIYSLGLVFYEMITGRAAFAADTFEQRMGGPVPTPLAAAAPSTAPSFRLVVEQCTQEDPARRPRSAYAVAAALPGGDPLRIAREAGHTPSPGTVAAARISGVRPSAVWGWFAGAIAVLLAVVLLAEVTFLVPRAQLARAPAVLEEQARRVISILGRTEETHGRTHGFVVATAPGRRGAGRRLPSPSEGAARVYFEYRQGEQAVPPRGPLAMPSPVDLPWPVPGQRLVRLDGDGRLLLYRAEPSGTDAPAASGPAVIDWFVPFGLARLDLAAFEAVTPVTAAGSGDRHFAWKGPRLDGTSRPVAVQATAEGPWITLFRVSQDEGAAGTGTLARPRSDAGDAMRYGVFVLLLAAGVLLAWRNLRREQADRRGAWRLAMFMLAADGVLWASASVHTWDLSHEAELLLTALRFMVFTAATTWVFYIAIDPYVRRFWPQSIISWSRVLQGGARDPQVGRDALVGVAAGGSIVLLLQAGVGIAIWSGLDPGAKVAPLGSGDLGPLIGFGHSAGIVTRAVLTAVWLGLGLLLLLLLLRLALKRPWLTTPGFVAVAGLLLAVAWDGGQGFPWLTALAVAAVLARVLTRVGLLAGSVSLFTMLLLVNTPLTLDWSTWYAGSMALSLTVLGVVLAFGLHAGLSHRPT